MSHDPTPDPMPEGQRSGRAPRPTGSQRRRPRDPARTAALDTLRAVDDRDAYANLVLPGLLRERGITGRDAAFATELAYGTLRRLGTYDVVLSACSTRAWDAVDPAVRDVLRLGTHQLLGLRVPSHAAVSSSVDLVRAAGAPAAAGFVNAVLRKVMARSYAEWVEHLAPNDPDERLGLQTAHPAWIVRAWRDALRADDDELRAALEADNVAPAVTLVARPGRSSVEELLASGAVPGRWSRYAAELGEGDPAAVPAVRQHRAGVQDEGSQLMPLALAEVRLDGPDARWLDLCAGPGGKAALLDALAADREGPGTWLTAVEKLPHRADLVRSAVTARTDVVVADGTDPRWGDGSWDRVLLDAPCSGLGALRRRPEARWRKQPDDIAGLARLQRELLGNALQAVRPGGVVAYVTCSPHLAETRAVVGDLLRHEPDVVALDARAWLPPMPDLGDGPMVQLWPHRHGTDAMFLALLQRSP